jgi:hypothetical protein
MFLGPWLWPVGLTGYTPLEYWPNVLVEASINSVYVAMWAHVLRTAIEKKRPAVIALAILWSLGALGVALSVAWRA